MSEQQNVIYKGLGIFFSSKYKAVIQIGRLGCSHSLVSVVLIDERGVGGGVNHHILNVILSAMFQVHVLQGNLL